MLYILVAAASILATAEADYYGGSIGLPVTHIDPKYTPHYEVPKSSYGIPPIPSYGLPKLEHGLPKAKYGPPKIEYGAHKLEYGPPKVGYGAPKLEYGHPKLEYGHPKVEYGIQDFKHPDCYLQTAYETVYKTEEVPLYKTIFKSQYIPTTHYDTIYKTHYDTKVVPEYIPQYITETKYVQKYVTDIAYKTIYKTDFKSIYVTETQLKPEYITKTDYITQYETRYQPQYITETEVQPIHKTKVLYKTKILYQTKYIEKPVVHKPIHNGYGTYGSPAGIGLEHKGLDEDFKLGSGLGIGHGFGGDFKLGSDFGIHSDHKSSGIALGDQFKLGAAELGLGDDFQFTGGSDIVFGQKDSGLGLPKDIKFDDGVIHSGFGVAHDFKHGGVSHGLAEGLKLDGGVGGIDKLKNQKLGDGLKSIHGSSDLLFDSSFSLGGKGNFGGSKDLHGLGHIDGLSIDGSKFGSVAFENGQFGDYGFDLSGLGLDGTAFTSGLAIGDSKHGGAVNSRHSVGGFSLAGADFKHGSQIGIGKAVDSFGIEDVKVPNHGITTAHKSLGVGLGLAHKSLGSGLGLTSHKSFGGGLGLTSLKSLDGGLGLSSHKSLGGGLGLTSPFREKFEGPSAVKLLSGFGGGSVHDLDGSHFGKNVGLGRRRRRGPTRRRVSNRKGTPAKRADNKETSET